MQPSWKYAVAAGIALASVAPMAADAAIRCNGRYQVNSLGEFESPYCEQEVLARLAHVPVGLLRRSWSVEQNACREVGFDIEISQYCLGIVPHRSNCTFVPC